MKWIFQGYYHKISRRELLKSKDLALYFILGISFGLALLWILFSGVQCCLITDHIGVVCVCVLCRCLIQDDCIMSLFTAEKNFIRYSGISG